LLYRRAASARLQVPATGLPIIPLYYANDDDGLRQLGSDSRLTFTAPADGSYLVRVSDVRGFSGDRFVYRLTVRESKPDFNVVLEGVNAGIPAGSGRAFTVRADRIDGFEGEIKINITDTPVDLLSQSTNNRGGPYFGHWKRLRLPRRADALGVDEDEADSHRDDRRQADHEAVNDFPKLNRVAGNPGLLVALEPYQPAAPTTQPTTKPTTRPVDSNPSS